MAFANICNPYTLIERKAKFQDMLFEEGATLPERCKIFCGVTMGESEFIGVGAVITKDVKPCTVMVRVPAKRIGWMSKYYDQISLSLNGEAKHGRAYTDQVHRLTSSKLTDATS